MPLLFTGTSWMVVLSMLTFFEQGTKANADQPLHTSEFESATVIGKLGKPLGTLVTVEGGYVVQNDIPNTKRDESAVLLDIVSVDGKAVSGKPIRYEFPPGKLQEAVAPKAGQRFKLVVYEAGGFNGDVDGAAQYEVVVAKAFRPFKFLSFLRVLRDQSKGISIRDACQP